MGLGYIAVRLLVEFGQFMLLCLPMEDKAPCSEHNLHRTTHGDPPSSVDRSFLRHPTVCVTTSP
eukprot:scaffold46307_cov23-Cyclotella_meneghiniana.AAC.1